MSESTEKNIQWYLVKIDRVSAWGLFISLLLFFISGYGMTKGFLGGDLAVELHNKWLPAVTVIFFVVHTAYAIHLAFIRWKIWNKFTGILLAGFFIALLGSFFYVDRIYETKSSTDTGSQSTASTAVQQASDDDDDEDEEGLNTTTSQGAQGTTPSTSNTAKTFTKEELATYNGKNGQPAYLAVDGVVYDLSAVFKNGYHYGHPAGLDLTNAFYKKHVKAAITKYPVVGNLK